MPDANGNIKGISVPAAAWERIFGVKPKSKPAARRCVDLVCGSASVPGTAEVDLCGYPIVGTFEPDA